MFVLTCGEEHLFSYNYKVIACYVCERIICANTLNLFYIIIYIHCGICFRYVGASSITEQGIDYFDLSYSSFSDGGSLALFRFRC